MRILHYSLGLYPYRTGGLNRYVTDLIREQSKHHQVALLYPNGYKWWERKTFILGPYTKDGIECYKLKNSMPLPLLFGIKNPEVFIEKKISLNSFERFFNDFKPNVLHIHTLMGLSEEILLFFKGKGVRLVYTSHDYFGICPKVNLINESGELCEGPNAIRCARCNVKAPSTLYLRLRNSSLAFKIRNGIRWIKDMKHF